MVTFTLKPKPWLLCQITSPWVWVTVSPHIYYPPDKNPANWPALVAHESVHIAQQDAMGRWRWLWRYLTNGPFRLSQEAPAMAVEIQNTDRQLRMGLLQSYGWALSHQQYRNAAATQEEGEAAIRAFLLPSDLP